MPRIDPQQLLTVLGILLSPSGGIKSSEEVERLVKLMSKFSRKLVSKSIYFQILQATPTDLLGKFLVEGGWGLLNTWFNDAIIGQNWPLVREMLDLFVNCPMTASLLKENAEEHQAPKLINQLRQEASIEGDIRQSAGIVYNLWVNVVSPTKQQPTFGHGGARLLNTAAKRSLSNEIIDGNDSSDDDSDQNDGGPVSLLQSLADEVSENLKKESTNGTVTSLRMRKVPTVQKQKSHIIDGSIKINKQNVPSKSSKSSAEDSQHKRRRSEDTKERSKRFRPDHRNDVNPEEKQRIKDMARKLKEESAQAKKDRETLSKSGIGHGIKSTYSIPKMPKIPKKSSTASALSESGQSFEDMLGGLDSKPKTVKTAMVKNKTAALLEGMTKSGSSSISSSKNSSLKPSKSSSSPSSKKEHHGHHSSHSHHSSSHHGGSSSKKDHHHSSSRRDSSSSSSSNSKGLEKKSVLSLTMPSSSSPETNGKHNKNKEVESPKSAAANKKSPHNFSESNTFMDAIFSSMGGGPTRPKAKKRKLSESKDFNVAKPTANAGSKIIKSTAAAEESAKKEGSNSPEAAEKTDAATPAFSFYQDTLEVKDETKDEPADKTTTNPEEDSAADTTEETANKDSASENTEDSPEKGSTTPDTIEMNPGADEDNMSFEEPESMPREVKGILVYHRGKNKRPEKKIKWRAETELVQVQYFEADENERVNVNKLKFENMRQFESKMEKATNSSKCDMSNGEDQDGNSSSSHGQKLVSWYKPVPISVTNREPFTPGETSKEKEIQLNREKNVLQVIYFSREMTPDTPKEAETEPNALKLTGTGQPAFIPLEDKEAGDENSEFAYVGKGWPDPKENQVSQQANLESHFSLPPALSALLGTINTDGLHAVLPPTSSLSKEEQDTLEAQTQALKAMGILPGIDIPPSFPPPANTSPPQQEQQQPAMGAAPPGFNSFPPPNMGAGFPVPPPFGGPPPGGRPPNGFYQQPPPFGGYNRNGGRGGGPPGGTFPGYRTNGPPQRGNHQQQQGNHQRDFRDRRHDHHDDRKIGTRPCKFFSLNGVCRDGDGCRFIHEQR
jgi:protein phosphatase 1 regulatory subunit 10